MMPTPIPNLYLRPIHACTHTHVQAVQQKKADAAARVAAKAKAKEERAEKKASARAAKAAKKADPNHDPDPILTVPVDRADVA